VNWTRKRWAAAIGAAFLLASLTTGASAAAAGSANRGGLGATEQGALPFGAHAPSAAERRALPAALKDVTVAVTGPWYVWNRNSVDEMEVYHSQTQNGAKVDQYHFNGTKTQQWLFAPVPGSLPSRYQLINANSSKCLDNTGRLADGVQMTQWTCESNNNNQIFVLTGTADSTGDFTISPWDGRGTYCVEVYHSSLADYAPVDEWHCNGTKTQHWHQSAVK
jgi:hypothetical protein